MDRGPRRHPMLRYRIAAGGLALLPALVVNASAQNSSLGVPGLATVRGKRGAKSYGCKPNTKRKNNLSSRKGLPRTARRDLRRFAAAGSHQRLAMRHLSQRDN